MRSNSRSKGGMLYIHYYLNEKELMIAAREGDTELMKLLIAAGANPHIKNNKGKTPIEVARGKCKEIPEMMAQ